MWGDRWDSNPQQPESQSGTLPLSYGHRSCRNLQKLRPGLPGGTRTHNPQLRRLVLYPVELRAGPVVGVRGFEPPTSCFQNTRATRLRHTPKKASNDSLSAYPEQSKLLATGGL